MKKIILLILFTLPLVLQSQTNVSGKVTDKQGNPIPGVSILVKETKKGVQTDFDGLYTINKVDKNATLIFSYLGYKTREEKVDSRKTVNIILLESEEQLDEVVIVGYGSKKIKDLTGSLVNVKADNLVKTATTNFDQALAGRIAGVQITSSDGAPGEGLNIIIRGGNSITGDNSPLYVVDGIPLEDFDPASISTNDIQDLVILKDTSATAIYGSRGSNGVILITTKGQSNVGVDGKATINFSSAHSVQWIQRRLNVMNPFQYVTYLKNTSFAFDGFNEGDRSKFFVQRWGSPDLYRGVEGTSWQDEIFTIANTDQYNFSIRAGTKTTNFYYSAEYLDQEGTVINTGFKKIINNLKVNHKFNNKTNIQLLLRHSFFNKTGVNFNGDGYSSVIRDAVRFRPIEPLIPDQEFDQIGIDLDDDAFRFTFNPVQNLQNTDRSRRSNVIRGSVSLNHRFNKKLNLKLSGNYQIDSRKNHTFFGKETYQGTRGSNQISGNISQSLTEVFASSNTLTYKNKFKKHRVTALAGFEIQTRNTESTYLENNQIPTDNLGIFGLSQGTVPGLPRVGGSASSMLSYFGRVDYDYKGKYLFSATLRADGSSKFSPENRWGYFPALNVGWKLSDERFMSNVNFISFAKLRAGWGIAGNNRIPDFASKTQLQINSDSGYTWGTGNNLVPGAFLSNFGVDDLKWESTTQLNLGLDLSFFNDRINTTIEVYNKETDDLLLFANSSPSGGLSNIFQNVGKVQNRGLEISLNTTNIKNDNFTWNSSFNISFNRNKTLALNSGNDDIRTNPTWDRNNNENQYITAVGQPVGMIYGLEFDRLYQVSDFVYDANNNSYTLIDGIPDNGTVVGPGSIKLVDQNGDGTIDVDDRVVIGNPQPKHIGGFSNEFKFGNFDAQILFQWSYDFDILNANRLAFGSPSGGANGFDDLANMWTPQNTNTEVNTTRFLNITGNAPSGNRINSRHVEDGSYIKLRTVSFGYTLPKDVLEKLNISSLRLFITGQNLFTWTNYSGYDPDVSTAARSLGALAPNLDYSAYPQSLTVQLGLNVQF